MKLTKEEISQIKLKTEKLESIKPILKQEFIGIDKPIDDIIDAMRPYYIFPKSLKRPLVVNLWGMTGTGKTSLLQRLCDLLSVTDRVIKVDVGDYATAYSDFKMKSDLNKKADSCKRSDMIIIFDEFQFGRTIDEEGKEVDRTTLRPMWELIDSGMLYVDDFEGDTIMFRMVNTLKRALKKGVTVNPDGTIAEGLEIYYSMMRNFYERFANHRSDVKDVDFDRLIELGYSMDYSSFLTEEQKKELNREADHDYLIPRKLRVEIMEKHMPWDYCIDNSVLFKKESRNTNPSDLFHEISDTVTKTVTGSETSSNLRKDNVYFIPTLLYKKLFERKPEHWDYSMDDEQNLEQLRRTHNNEQLLDDIYHNFLASDVSMKKVDFTQSLIFCVGNIDEAYSMSHSSNPDADADVFYEHSMKINVPTMKRALSERFRMEQIGRLGNNHIVYPSISKQAYRDIINLYYCNRKDYIKEKFDIDVTFDDSMQHIMYRESVFPSQGARPVLSSFNVLIDSYISRIIADIISINTQVDALHWSFVDYDNASDSDKACYRIKLFEGSIEQQRQLEYPVKLNVESLRKTDMSEQQAQVAVHEAGHAIVSLFEMQMLPEEVVSKTANEFEGFCRILVPEQKTAQFLKRSIAMKLGGVVAETMVFGPDMVSNGCMGDLENATHEAGLMVKSWGMADKFYRTSSLCERDNIGNMLALDKKNRDDEVISIMQEARQRAEACLQEHHAVFMELSRHLANNSKIVAEELLQMVRRHYPDYEYKTKNKYYSFREMINLEPGNQEK